MRRTASALAVLCVLAPAPVFAQYGTGVSLGPLTFTGYLQADSRWSVEKGPDHLPDTFRLRRVRLAVLGDITERVAWTVSMDLADTEAPLRDAYVTFRAARWMNVRAGQFPVPLSIERVISTSRLEAIDRTLDPLLPGRDIGVGVRSERPLAGWFGYAVSLVNGAGDNTLDDNDAKDVVARVAISPPALRGVTFAASGWTGQQPGGRRERYSTDLEIRAGHFHVLAEFTEQRDEGAPPGHGFYVLGARRSGPWEVVGRVSRLDVDASARTRVDAGGNYYFAGFTRVMANIQIYTNEPRQTGIIVRMQMAF